MKIITILFFGLTLLIAGNACAFNDGSEKADKNVIANSIDSDEFHSALDKKFKHHDKNSDGMIDQNELDVEKDPDAAAEFRFMDKNKDGRVSKDEFKSAASERFKLFDRNNDSIMTVPEYRNDRAYPILKFYF